MEGFEVDLEALRAVVRGMARTASDFSHRDTGELMPPERAVAHAGVSSALDEFADRWSRGLDVLQEDVREIGGRLTETATTYQDADARSAAMFGEIGERLHARVGAGGRR
ncbi:MAG: WXG100 family type VII secretion target [Sporichthyaceae bacterium]